MLHNYLSAKLYQYEITIFDYSHLIFNNLLVTLVTSVSKKIIIVP